MCGKFSEWGEDGLGRRERARAGAPQSWGRRWDSEKVPSALMHATRRGWRCMKHIKQAFTFPDVLQ